MTFSREKRKHFRFGIDARTEVLFSVEGDGVRCIYLNNRTSGRLLPVPV